MKAHPQEVKDKVLELLQKNRSLNEIHTRTGILPATIEDWAAGWRSNGTLTAYKRVGAAFTQKAKLLSNGLYPSIRIKYLRMRDCDKENGRTFGLDNQIQAIGYFIDENGKARPCAYCGAPAPFNKVWGLDRLDSSIGHIPGNLVPCCGSNFEGRHLSCQASKSCFDLRVWLTTNMSRAFGKTPDPEAVDGRVHTIVELAQSLKDFAAQLAGAQ